MHRSNFKLNFNWTAVDKLTRLLLYSKLTLKKHLREFRTGKSVSFPIWVTYFECQKQGISNPKRIDAASRLNTQFPIFPLGTLYGYNSFVFKNPIVFTVFFIKDPIIILFNFSISNYTRINTNTTTQYINVIQFLYLVHRKALPSKVVKFLWLAVGRIMTWRCHHWGKPLKKSV